MNSKQAKRLRKILLTKTSAVLALVRSEYGSKTEQIETPQGVWRNFKKLYKEGKVPESMLR